MTTQRALFAAMPAATATHAISTIRSRCSLWGPTYLVLVALAFGSGPARGQTTYTWNSGGVGAFDGDWTNITADGWNGGPPGSGDSAIIDNGTVTANANNQQQGVNLTINSTGVLDGASYLYFAGGSLTLNSGTINVSFGGENVYRSAGLGATVTANSGSSSINNTGGNNGLALENGGTAFTGAGDLTVGLAMHDNWGGASALTKSGTGTLKLTAVNTYTGGTTVDAGTLDLSGASGGTGRIRGAVTVNQGATLALTDGDGTGFGFSDQVTSIQINGGLVTTSVSNHIWNITGGITMTGGTLQSNNGVSDPNASAFQWNRTSLTTLASAATATIGGRINMRGDGGYTAIPFTVADGAAATDLLVSAAITELNGSLGITKAGAGTMALSGANSFTGATTVDAGTLALAKDNDALSATSGLTVNSGGTVSLQAINPMGLGVVPVTINAGGLMTMNAGHSINLGQLTLNGGELSSGGFSDPTYGSYFLRNDVSVGAGTSTISAVNITASEARTFTVASGGTLDVTGTFSNVFGSFGLTKAGPGTIVLASANTYGGATAVNAGTLVVNGSLAAASAVSVASGATLGGSGTIGGPTSILGGGILAPGTSPGTLTVNNTLALADTSILNFEIDPTNQTIGGGINDLVDGVTDLTLGGTLNLSGTGDFSTVAQGTNWRLINYSGTLTLGTLTIGTAPTLAAGLSFAVDTSTANQVNISVVPEPGSLGLAAIGLAAAAAWLRRPGRSACSTC